MRDDKDQDRGDLVRREPDLLGLPAKPSLVGCWIGRIRQNLIDAQREARFVTVARLAGKRTKMLKSLHDMRSAEEKLDNFEEEADLQHLKREVKQRQLQRSLELEDLKAEVEREKLYTQKATQQARRKLMDQAAQRDPEEQEGPPPPPLEEELSPEELRKAALQGVMQRARGERAGKEWENEILATYSPWIAQRILQEARRLQAERER